MMISSSVNPGSESGIGSENSVSGVKRNINYLHPEIELSSHGSLSSFSSISIGRIIKGG